MGIIDTNALVLRTIKYGDSSIITTCFTEKEGLKTYLIKGILKAKRGKLKTAYFQPLTQLTLTANHNTKGNLNSLKDAHVAYPYQTIHTHIIKQTMTLFLSEVLSNSIKEEAPNPSMYAYLETAFRWLDTHDAISNFHLLFLLNLTRFLGFYPDVSAKEKKGFHLLEGTFTDAVHEKMVIFGTDLDAFKKLIGIDFDAIERVSFHQKERQQLLQVIIRYFELHLEGFKHPKSLAVLEQVFQ